MRITPFDIQQRQFKVKFRGFDVREVDRFIDEVTAAFESLISEKQRLEKRLQRLEHENKGFTEREETFKRAMIHSQKVIDQMKDNASKSADLIIADAELKAEKILSRAHDRLSQLHGDIAELRRQRRQIEMQIQSIIETHAKMLEIGKAEMKANDAEDAKFKLLKGAG